MSGGTAFFWENFGPMHADRVDAVARARNKSETVTGIELATTSELYEWTPEARDTFRKVTLFSGRRADEIGFLARTRALLRACVATGAKHIFLCHHERASTLVVATALRLLGRRVYAMGCSKFDDYERRLLRELAKATFFLPYNGGISSGIRSRDYMRFLGLRRGTVCAEYNTLSLDRIRALSPHPPAPGGVAHDKRHFTIVARLVPKKNIAMALRAFALYRERTGAARDLHICGSGPLEGELRALAGELGIADRVVFHGFVQSDAVAGILGTTLAMLLPSIEEQFGNVVIEAQAMGVPVILSDNCGARDRLVRTGVNGFVIEPDNPDGLAFLMALLEDPVLWEALSRKATQFAERGDVGRFVEAVEALTRRGRGTSSTPGDDR